MEEFPLPSLITKGIPKGIVHKAVSRSTERRILSRIFQAQGTGFLCHAFARSYSQTCLVTSFLTPIRVHLLVLTHFMAASHPRNGRYGMWDQSVAVSLQFTHTHSGIVGEMCRWNSHEILGVPYGITLWHNQIWYPISNPNRPSLLRRHFFLGSLRPRVTSTLPWGVVRSLSATLKTRNILMCFGGWTTIFAIKKLLPYSNLTWQLKKKKNNF